MLGRGGVGGVGWNTEKSDFQYGSDLGITELPAQIWFLTEIGMPNLDCQKISDSPPTSACQNCFWIGLSPPSQKKNWVLKYLKSPKSVLPCSCKEQSLYFCTIFICYKTQHILQLSQHIFLNTHIHIQHLKTVQIIWPQKNSGCLASPYFLLIFFNTMYMWIHWKNLYWWYVLN